MDQFAVRRNHIVGHKRRFCSIVEEQQLTGVLIDFGMRRYGSLERAAEIFDPKSLKGTSVQFVGQAALVPKRQRIAVMENEIGIRRVFEPTVRPTTPGHRWIWPVHESWPDSVSGSLFCHKAGGVNPTVAIGRLAVAEGNSMDHAITVEPMVATARLEDRVRTVAQVHTLQVLGNLAYHRQIIRSDFSAHRGK